MIAHVYLHSPAGVATQRQVQDIVDLLYRSNLLWISARQASGLPIPECAKATGIQYRPPVGVQKATPDQDFMSGPDMFWAGHGSCCSIAPYDASTLTRLYGIKSRPIVPSQGGTSFHCNVLTPWGVYDPTLWWENPQYRLPPLTWSDSLRRQAIRRMVKEGGKR